MPLIKYLRLVTVAALSAGSLLAAVASLAIPAPAHAACGSLPSSLGKVTLTVNVPATGPYRIWARELAPSAGASGFYLQLADAGLCQVIMGNANIPANSWTWVDYQNGTPASVVSATISSGNHTIVIAGLSHGTEVDKIELLSDTACTPTGNGTNCTAAAVTATTTPGASTAPSASVAANAPAGNNPNPSTGTAASQPAQQLQAAAKHYFWPLAGLVVMAVVGAGWFIAHRAAHQVTTRTHQPQPPTDPAQPAAGTIGEPGGPKPSEPKNTA